MNVWGTTSDQGRCSSRSPLEQTSTPGQILDVRIGVAEHALSQARKSAKEAAKAGASGSL